MCRCCQLWCCYCCAFSASRLGRRPKRLKSFDNDGTTGGAGTGSTRATGARNAAIAPNPSSLTTEQVNKLSRAQLLQLAQALELTNQPLPPALANALNLLQPSTTDVDGTARASPGECDSGYASVGGSDTPSGTKSSSPNTQLAGAGDATPQQQVPGAVTSTLERRNHRSSIERTHSSQLNHSSQTTTVQQQQHSMPHLMTSYGVPVLARVKDEMMTSAPEHDMYKTSSALPPPKLEPITPEDARGIDHIQSPFTQQSHVSVPMQSPPAQRSPDSVDRRRYRTTAEPNSLGAIQDMIPEARITPHGDHMTLVVDVTASIVDAHMDTCIWTKDLRAAAFCKFEEFQRKRQEQPNSIEFAPEVKTEKSSDAASEVSAVMGRMLQQAPSEGKDPRMQHMWSTLVKGMVPVITRVIEFSKRLPGEWFEDSIFFHTLIFVLRLCGISCRFSRTIAQRPDPTHQAGLVRSGEHPLHAHVRRGGHVLAVHGVQSPASAHRQHAHGRALPHAARLRAAVQPAAAERRRDRTLLQHHAHECRLAGYSCCSIKYSFHSLVFRRSLRPRESSRCHQTPVFVPQVFVSAHEGEQTWYGIVAVLPLSLCHSKCF